MRARVVTRWWCPVVDLIPRCYRPGCCRLRLRCRLLTGARWLLFGFPADFVGVPTGDSQQAPDVDGYGYPWLPSPTGADH